MLKNYFIIALRNFYNSKYHFTLNVTGLVLGISCFVSLALFIHHELSYDTFYKDAEDIYRITTHVKRGDLELNWAVTSGGLAASLKEIAGVKDAARMMWVQREYDFVINDKLVAIPERTGFYSDSHIFNIFNFRILKGDSSMLVRPNSIVLTESFAKRLFGTTDVLGKTIISKEIVRDSTLEVTGLLEDPAQNSHIRFDFLLSGSTTPDWKLFDGRGASSGGAYVYFKTFPGVDESVLREQIEAVVKRDYTILVPERTYPIQKLLDIHFHADKLYEHTKKGNLNFVKILGVVALFIISISIINYVLLSTSQSLHRAREVGIRKVMGSSRRRLFAQFMAESILMSCIAGVIAIGVIELMLQFAFPLWFDIRISLWSDPLNTVLLFALSIIIGMLAGLFPALKITTFHTIQILKGKVQQQGRVNIRAVLITSQFIFTIAIVTGNIVVLRQLDYLKNIDPGLEKEHVINITSPQVAPPGAWQAFKQAVRNESTVKSAGITVKKFISYNQNYNSASIRIPGDGGDTATLLAQYNMIDYYTLPTLGIRVLEGRNFSPEFSTDSTAVILNMAAKKILRKEDLVGRDALNRLTTRGKIIGIIEDYHFQTFDQQIAPVILFFDLKGWETQLLVKFSSANYQDVLKTLEKRWNEAGIESPFQYDFVDDWMDRLSKRETQLSRMISMFNFISLVITLLGLLGVISYNTMQRKKEIGIRKVLGASVRDILVMINRNHIGYIAAAFIIAIPVSIYGITQWLQNFAYHVSITSLDYVITALFILLVATLAISLQSLTAAVANPVDTLKEE